MPNRHEPSRNASFACVHNGVGFTKMGLVSVVARTHELCLEDERAGTRGGLAASTLLVGFWTDDDPDNLLSPVNCVRVGDTSAIDTELRSLTAHGCNDHLSVLQVDRAKWWSTRYDEVVVDRTSMPVEAWGCRWSAIPKDVPPLAAKLMHWYTANPDVVNMKQWDTTTAYITGAIFGGSHSILVSTADL